LKITGLLTARQLL